MERSRNSPASPSAARDDRVAVEVRIAGRVQGVWFRGWTREEAVRLGLDGWVRNLADGRVAARFEGPRLAVDKMLGLCWEGPRMARVVDVDVRSVAPDPSTVGFEVRR